MEPQQKTYRQVIRNLGEREFYKYLTRSEQKIALGYPESCVSHPENPQLYCDLLSIDCQMVETSIGQQACRIVILNEKGYVYEKWFNVKEGTTVTNYLTHITGIREGDLEKKAPLNQVYGEKDQQEIQKLIEGKILVGHDLTNDFSVLKITHKAVIDTVALFPHVFGLPLKNKLKNLAFQYLNRHIQWGAHDPTEDALAAFDIVKKHVFNGQGIIYVEEFPKKEYNNIEDILADAELKMENLDLFVLRGSRALGLTIQVEGYKSDWDYVAVVDTTYKIDGQLIKLPEIDISVFDKNTFNTHVVQNNDISYLEIFFLPKKFVFINNLSIPNINLRRLRESLGFHLNKAKMKCKRLAGEVKNNPNKFWKILKTKHMKIRFMDNFLQLSSEIDEGRNGNQISIDVTRLLPLWKEIVQYCEKNGFLKTNQWVEKKQSEYTSKIRSSYQLARRLRYHDGFNRKEKNQPKKKKRSDNKRENSEVKYEKEQRSSRRAEKIQRIQRDEKSDRIEEQDRNRNSRDQKMQRSKRTEFRREQRQMNEYRGSRGYRGHRGHRGAASFRSRNRHQGYKFDFEPSSQKIQFSKSHAALATIQFLQKYGLEGIDEFRVSWKRHRIYPNLIQLHYQKSARFTEEIPRECRGMIVDEDRNFQIVALPYYKFFDYNDPKFSEIGKIDLASTKVYQKKDGSIAVLYYYGGQWMVSSSSVPDGQNSYCFSKRETVIEFGREFWRIFEELGYKMPGKQDINKVFIFQLMSKNHIIVVERQQSELCLHGVRNMQTLNEQDHLIYADKYGWKVDEPMNIQWKTIDDLVERVQQMNPVKCQGYVVCDKNYVRLKIKNSNYVRINWLGELNLNMNKDPRKYIVVQIILSGEAEVFCKYCPEWEKTIHQFLDKIHKLNKYIEQFYQQLKHLSQKKFSAQVNKQPKNMQTFMYALRSKYTEYSGRVENILNPKKFYQFLLQYNP